MSSAKSNRILFLVSLVLCVWSASILIPHWANMHDGLPQQHGVAYRTLAAEEGSQQHQQEEQPKLQHRDPYHGSTRSIVRVSDNWDSHELNTKRLREHGPCEQHSPSGDEAMVVRMYSDVTEPKKENIRHYSKELRGMDFWVLYDYGDMTEEKILEVEEEFRKLQVDNQFSVFMYNAKVAERMYPAARHTLEGMGNKVNWAIHEVSIAVWWRVCAKRSWGDELLFGGDSSQELQPKNVWSLEADAAFSGDVMTFFDYYKPYNEDFITGWIDKATNQWIAEKYEKLPGMSIVPFNVMYSKPDAVMRMSSRLLYHIDVSLRCNFVLYGEMYASTICRGIFNDWCTVLTLVDGPFYSPEPNGFNSVHYLTAEEWEAANKEPNLRNRWFHPIAALKEHA